MYHDSSGKFPISNDSGYPKMTAWFGRVDFETNQVETKPGFIMPFLENNTNVLQCPSLAYARIELLYEGKTGGYGYNQNLGTTEYPAPSYAPREFEQRMANFKSTSTTIVFSDAARIELPFNSGGEVRATENFFIQGPQDFRFFTAPGTHFRHTGLASVAFMDGHVESVKGPANVPLPAHWPMEAADLANQLQVGYLTEGNNGDSISGIQYHER